MNTCIFDLDGTLCNTLASLAYFVNTETAKHGLPPAPAEAFKYFTGNGSQMLIRRALAYHGITDAQLERTILEQYTAAYDADCLYLCTLYEGIAAMIDSLRKRRMKLAVLSNKPQSMTQKVINAFFAPNTFDAVFGQRAGVPLKPDPTAVYTILAQLHCDAADCLYIGDTDIDIKTGSAAGLTTVGVLWGFRTKEELEKAGACHIITKPADLLSLL
ncbi:MAG: HAD family hydrolase [Treponema sp.]